ncbi:fumarylacetoacetate hydrolase family protein [Nocardioides fonticola]|uniref:Fumarylacetoacetate hydrolase family protein n=1 Tax=Nocardioides fonticola TaxID=450363 RepID=A0ABP7XVW2_9ACTN
MRIVRFRTQDTSAPRVGVLDEADVVHALADGVRVLDLVASGELLAAATEALGTAPVGAVGEVELLAPIETPPSVRDFMAFEQHVLGMGMLIEGRETAPDVWYEQPLHYFSNPATLTGPVGEVPIPPGCRAFDFELEVGAVVGPLTGMPDLSDLTIEEAAASIAGYVLLNDWSARDLQAREMEGPLGPVKGKDSALSLGPWLLTADELPGLATGEGSGVQLRARLDGVLFGSAPLDSMAWSFAEMIAYASRGSRLSPGDLIGSGTCGDGCLAERWGRQGRDAVPPLAPGALVELDAGPLGATAHRVGAPRPVRQPLAPRRRADAD